MPIFDGIFFETDEELQKYIRLKELKEKFPGLTFDERIKSYIAELHKPEKETLHSVRERIGMSLFTRVADFFTAMWGNVWRSLINALGTIVTDIANYISKILVGATTDKLQNIANSYINATLLPEDHKKIVQDEIIKDGIVGSVFGILATFVIRMSGIMAFLEGSKDLERQGINKTLQPSLPDVTAILSAMFRDPKYKDSIDDYMLRMGFTEDIRDMYKLVAYRLLSPEDIRALYLRQRISKTERDSMLLMLGYRDEDLENIDELYKLIPAPPDIIRFAVREAFSESYISRYNMLQDLPGDFVEWAKKQGLTQYWAEKYWASHWELPSIQMAYEMLHRGVIDQTELFDLMRAQDVMPFWRNKLVQISYAPYTRVDVRRMYREGVIDEGEVYKTYKDLGYDHEHATNLTEFTVKDALQNERDLTKSDILKAYDYKIMNRDEALDSIRKLGYSKDESEVYLFRADLERDTREKTKVLSFIKKNYISGLLSFDEAHDRLGKLNLKGSEIEELFKDWDIERIGKMQELSDAKLEELFIEEIITEIIYKEELKKKGYSDRYIGWLVELTKLKIV